MPTYIASQDPVTIAATSEKSYDSMRVMSFRMIRSGDLQSVKVSMQNFDEVSGDLDPENRGHFFRIRDLDAVMDTSPKMAAAWAAVRDAVGLYYNWKRLDEKVAEIEAAEGDATTEIAARATALTALQAAV